MDVLAKAELAVEAITKQVKESGYEYADWKMTFSISLRAYLNRFVIVTKAEQELKKDFSDKFNKAAFKSGLDFKEVFKWIMSPLLTKALGVPANLDGSFLVSCIF